MFAISMTIKTILTKCLAYCHVESIKIKLKHQTQCILNRENPITLKALKSWLGAANQYRKYIPRYAEITKPSYDLMEIQEVPKNLRKKNGSPDGKKSLWNKEVEMKFEELKNIIRSD